MNNDYNHFLDPIMPVATCMVARITTALNPSKWGSAIPNLNPIYASNTLLKQEVMTIKYSTGW